MTKVRRVLCPTDFSPTADHAAELAAEMAMKFGADLVLLHVIPDLSYPLRSFGAVTAYPHLREELHLRAKEELDKHAATLKAGKPVTTELRDGAAHEAILACAKERGADLIVLGTHGHTGFKHMLLGSTAEKVVRTAACPVLTVRTPS
jgi:universal stress protein A